LRRRFRFKFRRRLNLLSRDYSQCWLAALHRLRIQSRTAFQMFPMQF
jgi:hypothetical protein